ncbi:MAG: CAP domain-containing protein, partial [Clostridia bacterium]
LPLDGTLSAVARKKSQDMVNHHYFAHISPTLGNANKMLTDSGYAFVSVGENIGRHASVEKAHAAFMSSTAHKRNILGSQWEKVGIGIALDANGYPYITQLFVR